MDATHFSNLVSLVKTGKQLPDAVYIHKDAFEAMPKELAQFIPAIAKAVNLPDEEWNLVKLFKKSFRVSLLNYPSFYETSYPALAQSLNVDLSQLTHKITTYVESDNPPILHRKETMVLPSNPHYDDFVNITQEGENAGLYHNTRLIGFKQSWENLIRKHGYELVDGRLFRASAIPDKQDEHGIDRHRTAIVRHELSAPMKTWLNMVT